MIRQAVLLILIGFFVTACAQNFIFGKCSPYSAPGTKCKR